MELEREGRKKCKVALIIGGSIEICRFCRLQDAKLQDASCNLQSRLVVVNRKDLVWRVW